MERDNQLLDAFRLAAAVRRFRADLTYREVPGLSAGCECRRSPESSDPNSEPLTKLQPRRTFSRIRAETGVDSEAEN